MKERLDEIPEEPIKPEADLVEMTSDGFEKFLKELGEMPLNLTMICVYHDPSTWPRLEKGKQYIKGICEKHLRLKGGEKDG